MKKYLLIPLFLFSICQAQTIDTLLGYKGKLIKDTALTVTGGYLFTPSSTALSFDSSKVMTSVTKNATGDSFYIWKGGVKVAVLPDGGGIGWGLSGNTGTTAGTNFLGTNDNQDVVFKRNDTSVAHFYGTGYGSLALGLNADQYIGTGNGNIYIGNQVGLTAVSGNANMLLMGLQAGKSIGSSSNNGIYLGQLAGYNTNVGNSVFIGNSAGSGATSATSSNFLGPSAGNGATGANNAFAAGDGALQNATAAPYSIAIGYRALYGATNAAYTVALGRQAGYNATNAGESNFLGQYAGNGATGAQYCNFIGYRTGYNATYTLTGINNIIVGTNITLPSAAATNMMTLGNVLYGTNFYGNTSGNPQNAAQINGHIGVNNSTPDTSAALDLTGYKYGFLPPRMTSFWRKSMNTGVATGTISGGTTYSNGTFNNVILTGGSGTGSIATISNTGGHVGTVTITTAGAGYKIGDVLSANASDIGGTGSGFTYTITALQYVAKGNSVYDSTINLNTTFNGQQWGKIPMAVATVDTTAQTTAITLATLTSDANNSTYDISGYILVTAISTDVIQLQCTYTDPNSNSQTVSWSNISTVSNSTYNPVTIRVKGGTMITLKTNLSTGGGTITYDAGGYIKKAY